MRRALLALCLFACSDVADLVVPKQSQYLVTRNYTAIADSVANYDAACNPLDYVYTGGCAIQSAAMGSAIQASYPVKIAEGVTGWLCRVRSEEAGAVVVYVKCLHVEGP